MPWANPEKGALAFQKKAVLGTRRGKLDPEWQRVVGALGPLDKLIWRPFLSELQW